MDAYKLSKALDNKQNEILLKLTSKQITEMNLKIINELFLPKKTSLDYMQKLSGYRYVDEINELKRGSYIRWINIIDADKLHLQGGAIISDIKITDNGTLINCLNIYRRKYFNIKMDECLIFQKITNDENVILAVVDYLEK
jgi:hypothetical protein